MSSKIIPKKWAVYPENLVAQSILSEKLSISPLLAQILINRGLDEESAPLFLEPKISHIQLPSKLDIPRLDEAAKLLNQAIIDKKKILIYGDYDVDGITGTTLLVTALRQLGNDAIYYIPHRYDEGYGLNEEAINKAIDKKVDLIVTVDCGISNADEVAYANKKGLDVIITDHHTPPERLPEAKVIIDPKLGNKVSPFYNLAGVGVAFKLAEKLFDLNGCQDKIYENPYLDLVSLGTITDIVPLLEANRVLVTLGLERLNSGSLLGIKLLQKISNSDATINTKAIGFVIGPRLNAAGRLDDASLAVDLLLSDDDAEALDLASKLNDLNTQRRFAGEIIKEDAINILKNNKGADKKNILICTEHAWHPGIIGIVASQLAKMYSKPTALIAINNGVGRGSIRSVGGIDILTPLALCQDLFTDYGGHKEAAGFTINEKDIELFTSRYEEYMSTMIDKDELTPTINIDYMLQTEKISYSLIEELEKLSPHGQGNQKPIFATEQLVVSDYRLVGNGNHLKMTFYDGVNYYDAIGFQMGHYVQKVKNKVVDVAYTIDINEWNGKRSIQLVVQDIR